jgi:diguanylate cyclase (GGDEF)-like protein
MEAPNHGSTMNHTHDKTACDTVPGVDESGPSHARTFSEAERRALVDQLNAEARAIRRLDYEETRQLAARALEIAREPNALGQQYTFGMATALSLLAHRNSMLGEFELARSQAAQAQGLLGTQNASVVLGDIYDCIGWCHFCLGDYAEALDFLTRALDIAEQIGDRSMQAYELDHMGSVHDSSGHADTGLEMQERALALHRELADRTGEAFTLNNVAYTYLDLGRDDDALASATSALRYAEEGKRTHLQMWVLDTLADVHLHLGDADGAERCTRRALQLAGECRSVADGAKCLFTLAKIAVIRSDWNEALDMAEQALDMFEQQAWRVERYECHRLISEIHETQRDFRAALEHFRLFHDLKEAKVNEDTASRVANLRMTHQIESARKDAEIHRLRAIALEREVHERRLAQAHLEAQASLDPLTGLYNRGHLAVLSVDLESLGASHAPVSLFMFDIDRFKSVNDTYGHRAGDEVLVAVAQELSANARDTDVACRYGGDEFLVLLVGMDAASAEQAAERLRERIAVTPVRCGDALIHMTISVGVATAERDEPADLQALIDRADRALYRAKESGRNRVVVEDECPPGPVVTPANHTHNVRMDN